MEEKKPDPTCIGPRPHIPTLMKDWQKEFLAEWIGKGVPLPERKSREK